MRIERRLRGWYVRYLRRLIANPMHQQRLKLLWDGWGYLPLLALTRIPLERRLALIARFLRVDWHVRHAHKPFEIAIICRQLGERRANRGEAMVEAGCWHGGSSAKFSIACKALGYRLEIYDSFEGVEPTPGMTPVVGYDFSGQYCAAEPGVRATLERFGEPAVCTLHKGWFQDTLGRGAVPFDVRVGYIDCDVAKGTIEALTGIVPSLTADGWIFSQDFHIKPVEAVLRDPDLWARLGGRTPRIARLGTCLAALRFPPDAETNLP
jgi:O-methyltransferase